MEKRRSTLIAVLLNLPLPGLGQLYCGRLGWGILFFGLSFLHWLVFIAAWVVGGAALQTALVLWYGTFGLVWLGAMGHGVLCARAAPEDYQPKAYNLWYLYALMVLVAWTGHVGMFKLIGAHWLSSYPLQSDGMSPGLLIGDWIRVDLRADSVAAVEPGAVVVARDPYDGQTMRVLRLVARAGDQVELSETGLSINGQLLPRKDDQTGAYRRRDDSGAFVEQRYQRVIETIAGREVILAEPTDPSQRRKGSWKVAAGQVFVLGDNRINAVDSTIFGPLPADAVSGIVFQIWFSRDPENKHFRPERKNLDVK